MMARGYFFRQEEEDLFFDPRDDLSSIFDSCPTSPATSHSSYPDESSVKSVTNDSLYQVWIKSPGSIQERRAKFLQLMGLNAVGSHSPTYNDPDSEPKLDDPIRQGSDRISLDCGAELLSSVLENESPISCISDEVPRTSQERSSDSLFEYTIKNLNNYALSARPANQCMSERNHLEDDRRFASSIHGNGSSSSSNSDKKTPRRKRIGWLRKLGAVACIVDRQSLYLASDVIGSEENTKATFRKIQVRAFRKESKEFSAVYTRQNFKAHHGAILTMKFSPDGEYLASAGEDGVVRVWQVMECARTGQDDIPNDDPTCIYFAIHQNYLVSPLQSDKEKMSKFRNLHITSDSACVVIPPVIFHIHEKPVYEFRGHKGTVLDLAWSKDKRLLSSSVDKTARLWQLGSDHCLEVFAHNNYVTCVQFNPIDESYFISGSLDGKVRIWEIPTCRVINWTDIKEIVTAVCFQPDGKGVVVGSMIGDCFFYNASDNHLQLESRVSFEGKKKSVEKRITGLQFCPRSSCKLMVTSANSIIRILHGADVVSKFKGIKKPGSSMSAAFTSDGEHIISASEDSKVYIWNHSSINGCTQSSNPKSIRSLESFTSTHVCIAVPWQGMKLNNSSSGVSSTHANSFLTLTDSLGKTTLYLSPPSRSSILSHEFFSEILHKGSATWPEEKLLSRFSKMSSSSKSHFDFMKNSSRSITPHTWGQVIVTASWDGRIRAFQNIGLPVHL